ncbi:hypothetical protein RQP46_003625 [Phenoliferia psychrophenolica]
MSQFKMTVPEMKAKATSFKAWEVPKTESAWTWTTFTFISYWMSDLVQGSTWSAVASLFSLGLNWWEGLLAIFSGGIFLCTVITFNGIIGAKLHTPFAVTCRAAFGPHFSKFCVVSRMVIAWFWFSIQTYTGGLGITQMIIACWPQYSTFPNHLPLSAGVTSQEFLSFFLFWIIQFPFCLVHPRKLQPIFLAKGIILPIVALGTMGWAIHQAGDLAGPALVSKSKLHGTAGYLAFMSAVTAQTGQWITLACNIGDFSRYSKSPKSATAQILIIPCMWTFTAMFGAIATQCLQASTGKILFTPFQIIELWQGTHVGRFFAFVCSAAWVLGYIGLNITANSISASNDLTTLFPRWITIFRGQMISVTVGVFAFAPWKVLASASSIVSFAGSYSIVLAPIASVMCADYFLVKNQHYDVPALYDQRPGGRYYYTWGCNWRSVVALICGIGPNIPGMGHALSSSFKIGGAEYIYASGVCWGVIVGGGVHVLLSKLFPDHDSLISESVYAHEVLADRLALGGSTIRPASSEGDDLSEKGKDDNATAYVNAV